MKLLIFPLIFIFTVSLLSMMGLGSSATFGDHELYDAGGASGGYFDSTGHQLTDENLTAVGESGTLRFAGGPFSQTDHTPHWEWTNATASYDAYNTDDGVNVNSMGGSFNLAGGLGVLGIVAAIMALATVVGIRIMGTGVADESVSAIIKGSALITLWVIFSALSMGLITQIPLFGPVFYFFLSMVYTLGVINQVGHPGED